MKILLYSDLHLEFGNPFKAPKNSEADLMILAGDIITFKDFEPLKRFLADWDKPVLYVAGNHEYYTNEEMWRGTADFKEFLKENCKNLIFLDDSSYNLDDVHFFGGTMWTDFDKENPLAMLEAQMEMNDFSFIKSSNGDDLLPRDTVSMHESYKRALIHWLKNTNDKKRVVISHHVPCLNPKSKYKNSSLQPAFNSLDMVEIIEEYQPEIWCYGHSHQCDDQMIGKTRVVSNQFGYFRQQECEGFNSELIIEI